MSNFKYKMNDMINHLEEALLAGMLFLMTTVTFSQVIARYLFNSGWIPAQEVTLTLFKMLVLMGVSWGIREKAHIGIDLVLRFFSPETKRVLALLAVGAAFSYGCMMLYGATGYFWRLLELGIEMVDLTLPRWVPTIFLPLGLVLALMRLAGLGLRIWRKEDEHILQSEAEMAIRSSGSDI